MFSRAFGEWEVGDVVTTPFSKTMCTSSLPPAPRQSLHTQDRNSKGRGCVRVLTNCPPYILFLEQGLELMRESSEPMERGIFDFYKVFSMAFGEGEDGAGGT